MKDAPQHFGRYAVQRRVYARQASFGLQVAKLPRQVDLYARLTRVRITQWVLLFSMLVVFGFASSSLAQTIHPNIVIILADDLGYGDVSFNGCPDYATPNIDSLATNGIWCPTGYVTHPFCSPSRAGLLTGRYQQRFGHENQPFPDANNPRLGLPLQETLLPQLLKSAGYVSGAVGKWHLGVAGNFHPMQRGFDEFFGFLPSQSAYYNAPILRDTTTIRESSYLTDAFTREAVAFINHHAAEPFFLYLAYNAVHAPYDTPPANYMARVANISDPDRQVYAAMVTALDDGVGQVLQTLQAQSILNKTLVFFLSDNGAPNVAFARNYPLRGYKLDVLEGGIRVPFAIQWPARLPAHTVYNEPISSLDIVATVAAASGISLPTDRVYDGVNLIPYLTGKQLTPERTLFWRWFGLGNDGPPGSVGTIWAARKGPLKLVTARDNVGTPPQLFNLSNDVAETRDLAESRPSDVATLTGLYNQWNAEMVSPLWLDNFDTKIMPLVLAGDWNDYNAADSATPWALKRITAPGEEGTPDAYNWFTTTIHVAATTGNARPGLHSFVLVGRNDYSKQWGGVTINVNGRTTIPFFAGGALGPVNSISLDDGYYSIRLLDWAKQIGSSMNLAVMKTSAFPVSVRLNGQVPATPTFGDAVVVNILTNQAKSVEERVYLRWSTDFFVTSHMVEGNGSGVDYSATIPPQAVGTGVQYCATTSTIDLSPFFTSGTIDSLTLATTKSATFVVRTSGEGSPTPTPTPTPTSAVLVTVQTTPSGLAFTVDGLSYSSTRTFSWQPGSSHTIATTSPQSRGTGVQYVWTKWSDNGTISHTVTPTANKTYTSTFKTQYYLTMTHGTGGTVSPTSGLKNSGAAFSISATPTNNTQVSYHFDRWTGTGTGSYSGTNNPASITMNGAIRENAIFVQNPVQVTVQTNPAGRSFSVDGTTYTATQSFSWDPGSSHAIATTSPQSGDTGVRYLWTKWSDNGAISHTVAPTTNKTYTANFTTQYYLTMTHGTGGTVNPSGGWRNSGAAFSISATPATGYIFSNWTGSGAGSYTGSTNPSSITMRGPITETANFTH